jgi:hypothetical protein
MVYTAEKPSLAPRADQLRKRIPGWGVDLDPSDRPAVPRERFDPNGTGAHWDFPDRQEEVTPRERSIEHQFLTPVFGTSAPLKGLSGVIRRLSYKRYSEARAAHWLLLLAADRVDTAESHLRSFVSTRPDNPITETGVRSEFTHRGISSRKGQNRADLSHLWMDPIIIAAPWVIGSAIIVKAARRARSTPIPLGRRRHAGGG